MFFAAKEKNEVRKMLNDRMVKTFFPEGLPVKEKLNPHERATKDLFTMHASYAEDAGYRYDFDGEKRFFTAPSPFGELKIIEELPGKVYKLQAPEEVHKLTGIIPEHNLTAGQFDMLTGWGDTVNDILADFCEGKYKVIIKDEIES